MDEIKLLRIKNKELEENNNLLHEYIEQNRITHLVARIAELEEEIKDITTFSRCEKCGCTVIVGCYGCENKRLKEEVATKLIIIRQLNKRLSDIGGQC